MLRILFLLLMFSCLSSENNKKSDYELLCLRIEKEPTNTSLLFERAQYNIDLDNYESAIVDLKQCIQIDSINPLFLYSLGEIYFTLSKEKNANQKFPHLSRDYLERSLDLDSDNYKAHALMGELLLAYREFLPAISYFNNSILIEYDQSRTHMLLGYAYNQQGDKSKAINSFHNAISVDPEYKEAYIQIGQLMHKDKDTVAIEYYNNALRIDSSDEIVLYNKAVFYQNILDWNQALESYAKLHSVNAFHSNGHYNLGFIHMELGLYDIAVNNFSDAIYSNSNFFEAYYSRGICFETLGNIMQAESDYKRAIEINSDYKYAIDALQILRNKNKNIKNEYRESN